jgi:hypothetical protein
MRDAEDLRRERRLLLEADALQIPWQAILFDEIVAERALQRGLAESPVEWPLACAFYLLPNSLLCSWRVRDRLGRLSWEASEERSREAAMQLRTLYLHLTGRRLQGPPADFLMASHLWFGYRRVLELRAVAQAANRSRGTPRARVEAVVARTRCGESDAEWAIERADSRTKSHDLDDAMRRAREEGFEFPQSRSEPDAFLRLRRFLHRRGFLPAKRGRRPSWARSFPEQEKQSGPNAVPGLPKPRDTAPSGAVPWEGNQGLDTGR